MNKYKNFTKMTQEQKDLTYGGWAWLTAALPHIIAGAKWTAMGAMGYKVMTSDTGQLTLNGMEAKWENTTETTNTTTAAPKIIYYAY